MALYCIISLSAKKILPGAKPVCQVPNLALGTHFRNTVDIPHFDLFGSDH